MITKFAGLMNITEEEYLAFCPAFIYEPGVEDEKTCAVWSKEEMTKTKGFFATTLLKSNLFLRLKKLIFRLQKNFQRQKG